MLLMGGGARIKSVQMGITTINDGQTTATATINPVNLAKTCVIADYHPGSGYKYLMDITATAVLTNATTLTFERFNDGGTCNVYWSVIEFDGSVNVQSFLATIPSGIVSVSVAISRVDPNKSFVLRTCRMNIGSAGLYYSESAARARCVIESDGQTVTVAKATESYTVHVAGVVVEVK